MKESLADPHLRAEIVARLRRLTPDSPRRFGRMTPHQAICHLSDSFRAMMAPTAVSSIATPFSRTVVKWVALNAPMKWPSGVKTIPEVDQDYGGTRPAEFLCDRQQLELLIAEFAGRSGETLQPHPIFGRMTTREWQRWSWRHMDHHLRQFNV